MPAAKDKADIAYLAYDVRMVKTKHAERSYKKCTAEEKDVFDRRCEELKQHTWHELLNMDRKSGLTPERDEKGNNAYEKTLGRRMEKHNKEDSYPFHFRVNKTFRVFGYQYKETFYITELDPKHKVHKRK